MDPEPDAARPVRAVSLMAIDLDTGAERDYLKRLAAGLELDAAEMDRIHEKLDAPKRQQLEEQSHGTMVFELRGRADRPPG